MTGPDEARGRVDGTVRAAASSSPGMKMASGGFDSLARTSLDAGTYTFDLSLGGYSETLSVDVAGGDTWGDVLGAVKTAVNTAPLAARADVVYQNSAYQLGPDMPGTGSVLTFSVNPERSDQDLRAADRSGGLLSALRMRAATNPVDAAAEAEYTVTGLRKAMPTSFASTPTDPRGATTLAVGRHDLAYSVGDAAQPETYISKAYDPDAATTLSAGTYAFTSEYAGEARSHSITIGSGWTWGQVLSAVSTEINAGTGWLNTASGKVSGPSTQFTQSGVTASVDYWPIPSSSDQNSRTDGLSLTVTGEAGGDFSLADTSGGLLSELGLTTKLTGTPVSFNVHAGDTWRDVYDSAAAAFGGAQLSLAAGVRGTRIPSLVTPGRDLWHEGAYLALTQMDQRIGERAALTDGRTGVLASLGISTREQPGQDGVMTVNGRDQVSENDTFSQDKGRVLLTLESSFGETLPLKVTAGMEEVEKGWNRVTDAWNGLARYLRNNSDLLDASLGARLEAPLAAHKDALRGLGVSSLGKSGQLWTNSDSFWKSLRADPGSARTTLWDSPDGLVPAWQAAVTDIREARLDSWLRPKTSFEDHRPALTSEFQLEQKHRLVKLLG